MSLSKVISHLISIAQAALACIPVRAEVESIVMWIWRSSTMTSSLCGIQYLTDSIVENQYQLKWQRSA